MTASRTGAEEPKPLRRDALRNRERILAAAKTLFGERGIETSLDEVAVAAEVGVGTVYRHYPSKDALLDELFAATIENLAAYADAALAEPDSWTALTGFIEHLAESFAENRALEEVVLDRERGEQRTEHARERLADPVRALVERAKADGRLSPDFAPDDVEMIYRMLAAVIRETQADAPGRWRRYFTLITDGLAHQASHGGTSADAPSSAR